MIGKVFLFALVCIAFAQVRGDQLQDEIEGAIEKFDGFRNSTQQIISRTQDQFIVRRGSLFTRTNEYIQNQTRFQANAISSVRNASRGLIAEAQEQNLGQQVFVCITKEAGTTILALSGLSTKFQTDMQRLKTTKLAILDQIGDELTQIDEALPGRYEQGITDLRNSATVSSVRQTLARLQREFVFTNSDLARIGDKMTTNNNNFERDAQIMTVNTNRSATLLKNLGLRNMRECMSATA